MGRLAQPVRYEIQDYAGWYRCRPERLSRSIAPTNAYARRPFGETCRRDPNPCLSWIDYVRGADGCITPRTIRRGVSVFCSEISLTAAGNAEQRKQATKGPGGSVSFAGRTGHYGTIAAAALWSDHRAFLRGMLTTLARVARVGRAIVVVVAIERFGCAASSCFATVIDGAFVVVVACGAIRS